jgi:tetratricopeptide (TPR) repeat protein
MTPQEPNKRLALLERLLESGQADAFAHYGLAMEYKKLGRTDDALSVFETLRQKDEAYIPQYLMAGQMLAAAGRTADARVWLEQGIARARTAGNTHALSELEGALAAL